MVPRHQGLRHLRRHGADPARRHREAPLLRSEIVLSVAVACGVLVAATSATGCKSRAHLDAEQQQELQEAAGPSTVQLVNMMGTCEDVDACERECDAGVAERCRRLATTYEFAPPPQRDEAKATRYFELACSMGDANACVSSGQMYEYHHGVAKDDAKAAGYYKKACDVGWQVGCANYAIMLENGRGVPKDLDAAARLYEAACKQGAGLACDRLRALGRDAGK